MSTWCDRTTYRFVGALAVSAVLHVAAVGGVFKSNLQGVFETSYEALMPVAALTVTLQTVPPQASKPSESQKSAANYEWGTVAQVDVSGPKAIAKPKLAIHPVEPQKPAIDDRVPPEPAQAASAPELAPAPSYLKPAELDPPPKPLSDISPEYPDVGGIREGFVVLRILINEQGKIDNLAVVKSFPKGLFDDAARTAFGNAAFSPGMRFGIPVKSQLTIEVHFTPDSLGGDVSSRGY